MKIRRTAWTLVVSLAVFVFGTGGALAGPAAPPREFRLGVLLPLTGPFAAVAETQRDGILLAVDEINAAGGLSMPWGRVRVVTTVADDEASLDVGVRRFMYLVGNGANAVVGQTWAPLAYAINEVVKQYPIPYFPICVMAKEAFKKGNLSDATWAVAFSPWSVGYMAGSAAINNLGKRRIFFLARSDSWGWDIRDGVRAAAAEYGAQIVGYDEAPLGTTDFVTILQKVRAARPDVFISSQFGADAIALLKQTYDMGLYSEMTVFNSWITNVVARGIPAEALNGLYAMHYFYWDMSNFPDREVAQLASQYVERYRRKYGAPPDAYATIAYVAAMELFKGVQAAGTFDAKKVSEAIRANAEFMSVKGPARWREDHSPVYRYAGFLVKGKGPRERSGDWDLFTIVGYQGGDKVMPPLESLGY